MQFVKVCHRNKPTHGRGPLVAALSQSKHVGPCPYLSRHIPAHSIEGSRITQESRKGSMALGEKRYFGHKKVVADKIPTDDRNMLGRKKWE